jgi:hypothetical protein
MRAAATGGGFGRAINGAMMTGMATSTKADVWDCVDDQRGCADEHEEVAQGDRGHAESRLDLRCVAVM